MRQNNLNVFDCRVKHGYSILYLSQKPNQFFVFKQFVLGNAAANIIYPDKKEWVGTLAFYFSKSARGCLGSLHIHPGRDFYYFSGSNREKNMISSNVDWITVFRSGKQSLKIAKWEKMCTFRHNYGAVSPSHWGFFHASLTLFYSYGSSIQFGLW